MKFSTNSLAFRLLFSVALWVGLGAVATGLLVSHLFRWNLEGSFHDELRVHITELEGLTELEASGQPRLARRLSDPRYLPHGSGYYWQVERAGFRTLVSPSLGTARLHSGLAMSRGLAFGWQSGPTGETLLYSKIMPVPDGRAPVRLLIATDQRLLEDMMSDFNGALISTLAGIAGVMVLGGLWHVGYTLLPLRRLAVAVNDIRQGRTVRMTGPFPAEIQPLVDDLNDLLETKEERAAHHRLRASNLAHGLRTPLTVLMSEADQLEASGHEDAARVVIRETERMRRHIDYHLARARTAIDQPKLNVETSLQQALVQLIPAMTRLHRSRGIAFLVDNQRDVMLRCDAADLVEMLSNLLDNAGKWATTVCHVDWRVENDQCRITIRDDGPGIEPNVAQRLFEPGERLDDTQPGSGLGLPITRELALHYKGDVKIERASSLGCTVVLTLPCSPRNRRTS